MSSKKVNLTIVTLMVASLILSACATPTPEVVEKIITKEVEKVITQVVKETVKETVVIEGTPQVVEKEVTKIVEKMVTATPEPVAEVGECTCGDHTVILGLNGDGTNINPILCNDTSGFYRTKMMFDTLIDVDLETIAPVPRLAESWDISDDGTTYTFHLTDADVRWHDGEPFTVEDIEFTLLEILKPTYTGVFQGRFADLVGADAVIAGEATELEGFQIIDDRTVQFKLNRPNAPFLARAIDQLRIIPKHLLEGQEITTEMPFSRSPVGTGPYKFVSWDPGNRFIMERNEDYWGEKPCTKRIEIVAIPDMQALAIAMEAGDIDAVHTVATNEVPRLAQIEGIDYYQMPSHTSETMFFNFKNPILQDVRVRQAIAHAIDTEAFCDGPLMGLTTPSNTLVSRVSWAHNQDIPRYEYDPEKAKQLLTEAGYPDGFAIKLSTNAGNFFRELFVEFAQAELAKIGIQVEVVKSEWGTFLGDVIEGNYETRFQAEGGGTPDPDDLYDLFHSESGSNYSYYSNPEVDELLEKARVETDFETRKQLYYDIQQILYEDLAAFPVFWRPTPQLVKSKFQGVVLTPLYFHGGIHRWCSTE